jgi:hypothetical protein
MMRGKSRSGVVLTVAVALSGCGWSGLPYPGTAGDACLYLGLPLSRVPLLSERPDGCFNLANLGTMLADPRDIERGRELAPADGERAAAVNGDYQAGKPKGAAAPAAAAGMAAAAPSATQ